MATFGCRNADLSINGYLVMANVDTLLRAYGVDPRRMEPRPSGVQCQKWLHDLRSTADESSLEGGFTEQHSIEYVVMEHGSARGEQYTLLGGVVIDSVSGFRRLTSATFVFDACVGDEKAAEVALKVPADEWFSIDGRELSEQARQRLSSLQIVF